MREERVRELVQANTAEVNRRRTLAAALRLIRDGVGDPRMVAHEALEADARFWENLDKKS